MEEKVTKLPSNAYKELEPGEKYVPIVPAEKPLPEITLRSVLWGIIWAIIFSFSAAYLGLKVGQVFEAAIPIAILAVGIGRLYARKNTILENVIIQSIGSVSGVIVAGAIFTIPALYILQLDPGFFKIVLVAMFGGVIGIYFLIPLRQYFVVEEHGRLPFPEGTATTEILVSGEEGGEQAKVLGFAMVIGGIYEFVATNMHIWKENITFLQTRIGETISNVTKMEFRIDAIPSIVGLGYIVGFKFSTIILLGSIFANWAIIPAVYFFGQHLSQAIPPGTIPISEMEPSLIFARYVRNIGIGAIGMAGVIGIIKSGKVIWNGFGIGIREIFQKGTIEQTEVLRTDKNISMKYIILGIVVSFIMLWVFFQYGLQAGITISIVGLIITFVFSFIFTSVAAHAIALVGTNPVSGMTLVTLIVTGAVFFQLGAKGNEGIIISLMIGGVICTALSIAGSFITDLKIGYWIGATPKNQERYKFVGVLFSSFAVAVAIWLLSQTYWFGEAPAGITETRQTLPAPQAQLMKTIIQSIMSDQAQPWLLFAAGGVISLIMQFLSVSPIAFALGMYLPLELNTPLFVGGLIAYLVKRSSKNEEVSEKRKNRGILIASGFIAGGALMGIVGALLKFINWDRFISLGIPYIMENGKWVMDLAHPKGWYDAFGEWISVIFFIVLCLYVYFDAKKAAKDKT